MADMRDRLIELLANKVRCPENVKNCGECPCFDKEYFAHCNEDAATADMLLANGVILQEWISVDDRLPEENERVLACYINPLRKDRPPRMMVGEGTSTQIVKGKVYLWCGGWRSITHWMPLPEPPKAEKALREKDE